MIHINGKLLNKLEIELFMISDFQIQKMFFQQNLLILKRISS
jgi:hypothetical protein